MPQFLAPYLHKLECIQIQGLTRTKPLHPSFSGDPTLGTHRQDVTLKRYEITYIVIYAHRTLLQDIADVLDLDFRVYASANKALPI